MFTQNSIDCRSLSTADSASFGAGPLRLTAAPRAYSALPFFPGSSRQSPSVFPRRFTTVRSESFHSFSPVGAATRFTFPPRPPRVARPPRPREGRLVIDWAMRLASCSRA